MSIKARAKFKVNSVKIHTYGEEIEMSAVCYDDNDENKSFSEATPSGDFKMSVSNKALFGAFKPDEEYYLDFTPVPEAKAAE